MNNFTNYDSNNSNDNINIVIIITIVRITHMKQNASFCHKIAWYIFLVFNI